MTRAERVSHAVTALREARATDAVSEPASTGSVSELASMTFRTYEDNGGAHHWTLVADGDELLVHSAGFGTYEEAKQAADAVHRGASRASFEARSSEPSSVDLAGRRDAATARDGATTQARATARDRSDAERWLDEGGSFTTRAGTR